MQNYTPQTGDIILIDGTHTGAKIVKFFMTAPTWYQYIYRAITKKQEIINYYHVAMVYSYLFSKESVKTTIIEQQKKVQFVDWNPSKKQIIFRKTDLSGLQMTDLKYRSKNDLGLGYDILSIFGKTLTWLTGIKYFSRYVESPKREICINRVASWYLASIGEKFGAKTHTELTTQDIYKYMFNSNDYEVVYRKD